MFTLILITLFATLAFVDQLLDLIYDNLSDAFYPPILGNLVFYISSALGILYISKLYWLLLVLDFVRGANKEDWDKYPLYRTFDGMVCCMAFLIQLWIIS